MSQYVTTTSDNFPIQDITHKPKRMQSDMIKLKSQQDDVVYGSDTAVSDETLEVITLERAISYYKRKSTDEVNGKLYTATAKWLEELLVTRTISKTEAARKAVVEEENKANVNSESE